MSADERPRDRPYFQLFGPLAVTLGGQRMDLGGRLRRALLADLALHANEVLSTDRLVEDLWGESPPADPLNTLQVYVGQLRRMLEPGRPRRAPGEVLVSTPPGYELVVDDEQVDALLFEALVVSGNAALSAGDVARGANALRDALGLWRGDVLPEFVDADFARARVARLREMRLAALEARIDADLAHGNASRLIGELETLTGEHPFSERLWELRMLALYRADRSADALRAYQDARRVLGEELGIEPGPKLRDLDLRIARRDPDLDTARRRRPTSAGSRLAPVAAEVFVGRTDELARLETLLERAVLGSGSVAVITGEAGLGKSRLVTELATGAWTRGCVVAAGRCFEGASGAPFAPITECLAELVRSVDPVALRGSAERAAAVVARLLPRLHDLMGELPEPPPLPPEEDRARLFDGVARLVIAATELRPTVLVLDDLQWADLSTLAIAGYLARAADAAPLLIIGCYRPDEIDPGSAHGRALAAFEREGHATQVALAAMTNGEASALVHAIAGPDADLDAIAEVTRRARGHPFFLHELARATVDGTVDNDDVPRAASELVLHRLQRLPTSSQRLAAAASVFEGRFGFDTAAAAAGLEEHEAVDALDALIVAGLAVPTSDEDFEFVHDIARQALYAALTPIRRARLHRAVVSAIEQRWPAAAQEAAAASLAHHYLRSLTLPGVERGAAHAERAAAAAERAYAYSDAARMLGLALRLLPPDNDTVPQLLARLGQACIASGDEHDGLAALLEAAPRIAAADGRFAAAETLARAATYAIQRGAWDAGPELTAAGLSYVDEEGSPTWAWLKLAHIVTTGISDPSWPGMMLGTPDQIDVATVVRNLPASDRPPGLSLVLFAFDSREDVLATMPDEPLALAMWAGEYTRALELVGPMAEEDEDAGRIELAIVERCVEARCLNALGRFDESDIAFGRGVGLLRRLVGRSIFAGHLLSVDEERFAALGDGWGHFRVDLGDVIDHRSLNWYSVPLRVSAACALAHLGSTDEAMEHLIPALPAIEAAPAWSENYVRVIHAAAEVHWIAGRDDHAALIERNARDKLLAPDFRYPMTDLRLTLARLVAAQGRPDEAAEWFERAREVLDEQQALPLRIIVDHDQGLVEARMGHADAAHALLTLAHDQATSLGMHGWARAAASARTHLEYPRRERS